MAFLIGQLQSLPVLLSFPLCGALMNRTQVYVVLSLRLDLGGEEVVGVEGYSTHTLV